MSQREPTINGDERDWVSPSRHIHTAFGRPGAGKRIKQGMTRRERRLARKLVEQLLEGLKAFADELEQS